MDRDEWNVLLRRLERARLIKLCVAEDDPDAHAIDVHPLVRGYFDRRLRKQRSKAFRAAHLRLFDHLCATTPHRPDTLAGLQPLYQAVAHGCLAGRQQEAYDKVYMDRILRGNGPGGNYCTYQLGAIGADPGAVAAVFEEPWRRLAPNLRAPDQAWLLNAAAYRLRALRRLTEAVEPKREGMNRSIGAQDWKQTAIIAGNLRQLEVTLGRLGEAVAESHRAIDFADRRGDGFWKVASRIGAADALHQAGRGAEAGALFANTKRMQAEMEPESPRLHSLQGFWYADWLRDRAERAAWSGVLAPSGGACRCPLATTPEEGHPHLTALDACAEAEKLASSALPIAKRSNSRLDIAHDHLTLARAALYGALVGPGADRAPAATPLEQRVATDLDRLRQANRVDHLPKALFTAALYHGTLGADLEEARRLLDEAQQIAERGPMPLHLADVQLHRARLFRDRAALAEARALIERHGYGRRRDELADAEAAAAHW